MAIRTRIRIQNFLLSRTANKPRCRWDISIANNCGSCYMPQRCIVRSWPYVIPYKAIHLMYSNRCCRQQQRSAQQRSRLRRLLACFSELMKSTDFCQQNIDFLVVDVAASWQWPMHWCDTATAGGVAFNEARAAVIWKCRNYWVTRNRIKPALARVLWPSDCDLYSRTCVCYYRVVLRCRGMQHLQTEQRSYWLAQCSSLCASSHLPAHLFSGPDVSRTSRQHATVFACNEILVSLHVLNSDLITQCMDQKTNI